MGPPEPADRTRKLAGVLIGWRIARSIPAQRLKCALVAALLLLAPYLALHN